MYRTRAEIKSSLDGSHKITSAPDLRISVPSARPSHKENPELSTVEFGVDAESKAAFLVLT